MHQDAELPLVEADAPMRQALIVMTEKRFGVVGVVGASGVLEGVVTDGDLRRHMDGLLDHTAGEIMTPGPAPPRRSPAAEALRIMNEARITVLFVLEDGRPGGDPPRPRPAARRRALICPGGSCRLQTPAT
jgi:arabinose-5-phosphate isomerase